jgi:hypothetical protein
MTVADHRQSGVLSAGDLADLPGRDLEPDELLAMVRGLALRPELWERHTAHDTGTRHYVSLHRDTHVDLWLLCWNSCDDTGFHDHDISAGAVAVVRGAVRESRPRLARETESRVLAAGRDISFDPDYIHRMSGEGDGGVSIHAYSPPLWRMGQYAVTADGVLRRRSVSYADELRPLDE